MKILKDTARIAQFDFSQGRCGENVLDCNNRLLLRVVDEGALSHYQQAVEQLALIYQACAQHFFLGWFAYIALQISHRNSEMLRGHLIHCLDNKQVYRQCLDDKRGGYHFRLVSAEDVPTLRAYLEGVKEYQITFLKGSDPTVVSLTYLSTCVVS
jgi:hypothetical protein